MGTGCLRGAEPQARAASTNAPTEAGKSPSPSPQPPGHPQQRRYARAGTKREAIAKLERLKAELRDGHHTSATLTVEQHTRGWIDANQHKWKPATLHRYRIVAKNHITPHVGSIRLKHLTSHHIQNALRAVEKTAGPAAARVTRSVLNGAMRWGVQTFTIPRNVVEPVTVTPPRAREPDMWTPAEAATFLEHTSGTTLHALVYTLLTTGLRRGEALAATWGAISDGRLLIRQTVARIGGQLTVGKPKTKKSRRLVVLPPDTLTVLELHKSAMADQLTEVGATLTPSTPIFCDELGGYLEPDWVLREFKKAAAAAGVRVVTLHNLRHWHGSSLAAAGLDPVAVAARLGHSAVTTTMDRYAHAFERQRRKAALSLGELAGEEGA